jgi:acetylornithine deacetylase/succinyl-diaminopimelate desuccinylase-like protein
MSDPRSKALEYAQANNDKFRADLEDLLKIESISTEPEHKGDVMKAAEWCADKLKGYGFENVKIYETTGQPSVIGEHLGAGPDAPTLLVYGHFDVQPVDPIDLWDTDPFDPTEKDGRLYARGASDMKGQVVATLAAIESALSAGEPPVNIKFYMEGEEEVGSPAMKGFLEEHHQKLKADFVLNPDGGILGPDKPTITYALRGLAYFQLDLQGPAMDLHSGMYGGVLRNPANELARLIAGMHDAEGRVTLPGFYDDVLDLSDEERANLAKLPMTDDFYREQTGQKEMTGEAGYSSVERATARPTLDVNGLLSGWTGEGSKTVLPAKAMAKISCRLVANQEPAQITKSLRKYVEDNIAPGMQWELKEMAHSSPSITPTESDVVKAMQTALETVWGKPTLFRREGGTVPVSGYLKDFLGIDSVVGGFGLPDDRLHSPNESLHLATWTQGIDAFVHFLYNLSE